jgi:hypothetical protein
MIHLLTQMVLTRIGNSKAVIVSQTWLSDKLIIWRAPWWSEQSYEEKVTHFLNCPLYGGG